MKAVYIEQFGGAENISVRDVDDPSDPIGTEVVVLVRAAGLNRADLLQRQGFYPAPKGYPERVPGLEFAGKIVGVGAKASRFRLGDRVFGITAGGAQAEFIKIDESLLAAVPDRLDLTEAAAVPEAFITAHDAIIAQCELGAGETLLIHAVGSGVGLAALQIAKARSARVLGTSRTPGKLVRCAEFGLDLAISSNDFAAEVKSATNGHGVNVILDLVGAKAFSGNLASLAVKGRMILVGLVGGRTAEFDLGQALSKRLTIIGTVLRSRSAKEKADATARFVADVIPLFERGDVRPNVDRVFDVAEVRDAHRYLESNESFGKVVLQF